MSQSDPAELRKSDPAELDPAELRKSYQSDLTTSLRCETCRHAQSTDAHNEIQSFHALCKRLEIHIDNVRKSYCRGFQDKWRDRLDV